MKKTSIEEVAQAAGYPSTLFGFTPNEPEYWFEPDLPWVSAYLEAHPDINRSWRLFRVGGAVMAPRFAKGAVVAVEQVLQTDNLLPGVYVWHRASEPIDLYHIGRLQKGRLQPKASTYDGLLMSQDNSEQGIVCLLEWELPGFALYRVTYYNTTPVI